MEFVDEIIDFPQFSAFDRKFIRNNMVHPSEMTHLINFFDNISIEVEDVTNEINKSKNQKVVKVKYSFDTVEFFTKPLYYKNIIHADNVKQAHSILNYFEDEVYWLDIEKHYWPRPKDETDIDTLIINDITDDERFKKYLKLLANNLNNGFIQRITKEGRSSQYYRNLENNNHWHDLILLIKEYIKVNGEEIDKKYFKKLVFKWDGNKNTDRLRSSLSSHFGNRALIEKLKKNIKLHKSKYLLNKEIMRPKIDLLKYKKQIILQGPPGTGKTREAKLLAKQIIGIPEGIIDSDIVKYVKNGISVKTSAGLKSYLIKNVDIEKRNILVFRESDTSDYTRFDDVIDAYSRKLWNEKIEQNSPRRAATIAKYIYDELLELKNCEQYKLLQFHPSYTYEDFVRGIVSKPNQGGDGIIYEAENKFLGKFAKDALDNFLDSKKDAKELNKDLLLKKYFNDFVDNIQQIINTNGFVELTDSYRIIDTEEDAFRYLSKRKEDTSLGNRMLFKDIIKAYVDGNIERQDIKHNDNLSGLAKHHSSYYVRVVNMFQSYLKDNNLNFDMTISDKIPLKNYVLIIDEINRANLSAVLGELIYALEYRGEAVESMYAIDGDNKLILPPNLYIIGTMNTADRSVGHIDYAIRRRFAFVDVLPKDLSAELKDDFRQDIFATVAELFIKNYDVNVNYSNDDNKIEKSDYLTADFAPKDVWLGHSYFIQQYEKDVNGEDIKDQPIDFNLRIKYEIKPILREYVKDGILKESALSIIEELN